MSGGEGMWWRGMWEGEHSNLRNLQTCFTVNRIAFTKCTSHLYHYKNQIKISLVYSLVNLKSTSATLQRAANSQIKIKL